MTDVRRDILAVTCAISAGIHAGLVPDHLEENIAAGVGFAASAVVLAGLAVAVARQLRRVHVHIAVVVFTGLIVAYVLAVTTGVPGLVPEPEPVDGLAVATKLVEVIGLAVAISLEGSLLPRLRPIPVALVAVVVAFSAAAAVALSSGHGGHPHEPSHHHHPGA
jgi:drug/metabolite transporter (DMT)-like permease